MNEVDNVRGCGQRRDSLDTVLDVCCDNLKMALIRKNEELQELRFFARIERESLQHHLDEQSMAAASYAAKAAELEITLEILQDQLDKLNEKQSYVDTTFQEQNNSTSDRELTAIKSLIFPRWRSMDRGGDQLEALISIDKEMSLVVSKSIILMQGGLYN